MGLMRIPKEYSHLESPKEVRWVHQERVWMFEEKGYAVNELKGADYGGYDLVLMVKKGCEPKPKAKKGDKK